MGVSVMALIEVKELTKYYGDIIALDRVSFSVSEKGVVGLIGPNGAGKTTLIRILSCQLSPSKGRARVLGYEVGRDDYEIKKRIAVLPQEVRAHFYLLTPLEYIYYYLRVRGLKRREAEEKAHRAIKEFGIDYWNRKMVELSPGMARKALLAMILSYDAEIYFLDEPTIGLDPTARYEVWSLIRKRAKDGLVFITSHHMDEISRLCDRVLLIENGKLLASGSPEEVAARFAPHYYRKIVVVGNVKDLGYENRIIGRYTYIYVRNESELNDAVRKLSQLGYMFRIEEVSIEDYFILRGKQ